MSKISSLRINGHPLEHQGSKCVPLICNRLHPVVQRNNPVFKNRQASSHILLEPLLLEVDDTQDELSVQGELTVDRLEPGYHLLRHISQEGASQAQAAAVADGAPDDAAQHVAAALVAWHHAVPDQEG